MYPFLQENKNLIETKKIRLSTRISRRVGNLGDVIHDSDLKEKYHSIVTEELKKSIIGLIYEQAQEDFLYTDDYTKEIEKVFLQKKYSHQYAIVGFNFLNLLNNYQFESSIAEKVGNNFLYKIGDYYGVEVFVNAYLSMDDNKILFCNSIFYDIDEHKEETPEEYKVNFSVRMDVRDALLLYVIDNKDDPNYGKWISKTRDSKIDDITI